MGVFTYNNYAANIPEELFTTRGHRFVKKINQGVHTVAYSNKILVNNQNYYSFSNGDYIIGIGTYLYKHKFGYEALQDIFIDFQEDSYSFPEKIYGHYAFIIAKISQRKVYILNDRAGTFRLYYTLSEGKVCVSSSMLAVIQSLTTPKFDQIRLAAFLCTELGRELSFVKGVEILNPNQVIVITDDIAKLADKPEVKLPPVISVLSESVDYVLSLIKEQIGQFQCMNEHINSFSVELTGGLDSRLLSCILRSGHLEYDFVHYPLFGPDKEIAELVSGRLGKKLITIYDPKIPDGKIDEFWGEFDFMFNYYRHYPNQRWCIPHEIQFSGLQGECLSTVDFQSIQHKEIILSELLPQLITHPLMNDKLFEEYLDNMLIYYQKYLNLISKKGLSDYEQSLFIQHLFVQRTGDGPFVSAQNAHQYFYSVYNEYNFIHAISAISLDVRRGRKLSIALIKQLDQELASMPFVSRRRTKGLSIKDIESIPETYKSFNGLREKLPDWMVNLAYKILDRKKQTDEITKSIDYDFYAPFLSVKSLKRFPNLYSDVIHRLASVEVVRKKLNII